MNRNFWQTLGGLLALAAAIYVVCLALKQTGE
jgi:hypothetical protein